MISTFFVRLHKDKASGVVSWRNHRDYTHHPFRGRSGRVNECNRQGESMNIGDFTDMRASLEKYRFQWRRHSVRRTLGHVYGSCQSSA